ncbi:hypothetical protein ACG9YX_19280 [Acinetobacter nematophilus]|jgi:hypothetical protein|uniref:hypothetical protein n=1 Tax=Acinetobacter TaxID=469 RepID=UPI003341C006
MDISATKILEQLDIPVNPKTQAELEQRWKGIKTLKKTVRTQIKNDNDICIINTAGGDHVK